MVNMKIEYRLRRCLEAYAASHTKLWHMKELNKTESPIFVLLCVFVSKCSLRFSFEWSK